MIDTLHDLSIRRDINTLLEPQEPVVSKSKRKRDAFEDQLKPRILNTEERLENLENSQKKNVTKSVLKSSRQKSIAHKA